MDETLVYLKTPKGMAEMTTRGGVLSLASRRVLIMIDGRRTVADLAQLLKPGEIDGVIATLEAQGFVNRADGEPPRAPSRASDAPSPPTAGGTLEVNTVVNEGNDERNLLTLDEAKRRAVREISDRLASDGEQMVLRIERCKNADELRLREAERLIAGFYSEAAAQDFMRALRRR
jgi:hypothetical protein